MILNSYLPNLLPWIEQVAIFALVGALLPVLFQVRHPRTQLVYCHLILAACLLLPFLQPWRHPVVVISETLPPGGDVPVATAPAARTLTESSPAPRVPPVALPAAPEPQPFWRNLHGDKILVAILIAGIVAKLAWLLAGLWQIRRYRIAATPLYPIPESVQAASALTHADAMFCISTDITGPVMLGVLNPVILLPGSFLEMGEEAQCGIAAHELLHVKRKDWLITVLEEVAGAVLWFHPAVWWLLAQTRLAREQIVDAEAVRLTAARESYIHALLDIARSRTLLDLAPAPLFLRRRHLTQRMHSLLKETSVSVLRLVSTYGSIALLLGLAGWFSFASFPLVGSPQIQRQPAQQLAAEPNEPAPASAPLAIAAAPRMINTPLQPVRPNLAPPPADLQEPVSGSIQVPVTPADRAAALSLLERARQNSDMHIAGTPPFRLTATFQAGGTVLYVGSGVLSETWFSGRRWRWNANLANYAQARIGRGEVGFDEQPVASVPIRVHMLRGAIFWPVQYRPGVTLRIAPAQWNRKQITCILLGGQSGSTSPSRLWAEQEFCIEPASGLLQVWSPAPGTYLAYDYGNGQQFHGRMVPDRITAFVGGQPVLEARISIAEAGEDLNDAVSGVPGITLAAGQRFLINAPGSYAPDAIQTVIVHAEVGPAGNVLEQEISTSADPRLSQAALDLVRQHSFPAAGTERESYISVGFLPAR